MNISASLRLCDEIHLPRILASEALRNDRLDKLAVSDDAVRRLCYNPAKSHRRWIFVAFQTVEVPQMADNDFKVYYDFR